MIHGNILNPRTLEIVECDWVLASEGLAEEETRRIAYTEFAFGAGDVITVSTVLLLITLGGARFETMVFWPGEEERAYRHETAHQAVGGHRAAVCWVRGALRAMGTKPVSRSKFPVLQYRRQIGQPRPEESR